jgi:hypothetical protein
MRLWMSQDVIAGVTISFILFILLRLMRFSPMMEFAF